MKKWNWEKKTQNQTCTITRKGNINKTQNLNLPTIYSQYTTRELKPNRKPIGDKPGESIKTGERVENSYRSENQPD